MLNEKSEKAVSSLDIIQAIDVTRADFQLEKICRKVADKLGITNPSEETLERIASHLTLP